MKTVDFFVHPFCDNFEPYFSFQLYSSLMGGFEIMEIVTL